MKLTKSQSLMVQDGAPKALFLAADRRRAAWGKVPLRTMEFASIKTTRNEDEATAKFRAEEEARRKAKQNAHFDRLKAKKNATPVDYSKVRWDARRNKFVPQDAVVLKANPPMVDVVQSVSANLTPKPSIGPVVDKINAEAVAKLNGVWDPKYAKLTPGLLTMTVKNRLKKIKNVVMP